MARKRPSSGSAPAVHSEAPSLQKCVDLRLFVARPTPSSARAEINLVKALEKLPDRDAVKVEIVDVLQNPHQAVKDRIIVTPCLLAVGSHPQLTLIGDLQDMAVLLRFLERLTTQISAG